MNVYNKRKSFLECLSLLIFCLFACTGCPKKVIVPNDVRYIKEFNDAISEYQANRFEEGKMALFVDYSNCIADGMSDPFFQNIVPALKIKTEEYWAIEGSNINKKSGDTYELLRNVTEVNYARVDSAINMMADRNSESVLLTDGELFIPSILKTNPNDPYMYKAINKWLLKGNDIHILSQPYKETHKGNVYNKKRFIVIMTNDSYEDNIYNRIKDKFGRDIKEYHLCSSYKSPIVTNGKSSIPHESLAGHIVSSDNTYEIQDWQSDWNAIKNVIIYNPYDVNGNLQKYGEKVISGLKIDKRGLGCYEIKDIDVNVYNINESYNYFYENLGVNEFTISIDSITKINDFIVYDKETFNTDGTINLHFDINNFAPDPETELNGNPFNYFMIEIKIAKIEALKEKFDELIFDDIENEGKKNVSVKASIEQCVSDPKLKSKIEGKTLYRIFVKSNEY